MTAPCFELAKTQGGYATTPTFWLPSMTTTVGFPTAALIADAEGKFLTWTEDKFLRQVVYEGLREDKPAAEVRRDLRHPEASAAAENSVPRAQFSRSVSPEKKRHVGDMTLLCESRVVRDHMPQGRALA
jgi:hypothetical protein